jgi:hypothetical protein
METFKIVAPAACWHRSEVAARMAALRLEDAAGPGAVDYKGGMGMHNEFTAVIERDGEWFIAYCPETPGPMAKGGRSKNACGICRRRSI